jgi:hypothetical protein
MRNTWHLTTRRDTRVGTMETQRELVRARRAPSPATRSSSVARCWTGSLSTSRSHGWCTRSYLGQDAFETRAEANREMRTVDSSAVYTCQAYLRRHSLAFDGVVYCRGMAGVWRRHTDIRTSYGATYIMR